MLRTRTLVVGLLIITLGVACKKGDDKAKGDKTGDTAGDKGSGSAQPNDKPAAEKPADKPADKADDKPAAPAQPIKAGPHADDLSMVPVDSDFVLGFNFEQLQKSKLWKDYVEARMMADNVGTVFGEIKTTCKYDPMKVIKLATVGFKPEKKEGVVVAHGLGKSEMLACADKFKGSPKVDVTKDGEIITIKPKSGDGVPVVIGFSDDSTAVAVIGPAADGGKVKSAMAGNSGLKTSARFVDLYNKLDTSWSMWFVANGRAKAFSALGSLGLKPKAVYGALSVTDGLEFELRMRVASPDQATQWAMTFKQQVNGAAGMLHLDKHEVEADGSDVKVSVGVTAKNLTAMVASLKQVAAMAAGGMGGGAQGGMGGP